MFAYATLKEKKEKKEKVRLSGGGGAAVAERYRETQRSEERLTV